jgi:branched-chain amino acid transport system permease protein
VSSPRRGGRLGFGALGAIGLLALVVLPLVAGGYWTFTLGLCFANAIAIISVSFLVRYAGEV